MNILKLEPQFKLLIIISVIGIMYGLTTLIFPFQWNEPFQYGGFFKFIFINTLVSITIHAIAIVLCKKQFKIAFFYTLAIYLLSLCSTDPLINKFLILTFWVSDIRTKFVIIICMAGVTVSIAGILTTILRFKTQHDEIPSLE